jgi:lysophospholipase L1-like esterase
MTRVRAPEGYDGLLAHFSSVRRVFAISAALFLLPIGCAGGSRATDPPSSQAPAPRPTAAPSQTPAPSAIRYVALGDSYTVGTSVGPAERFPNQLVERLRGNLELQLVDNLGVNGFTTMDLIDIELPKLAQLQPEFVTLLIGVNDVVQRVPEQQYRDNVELILDQLLVDLRAERIVVVSIPDYTRSPRGAEFGQVDIQRAAISSFNEAMKNETEERGIEFVDISSVADRTGANPQLVADDQLHPSGEQYSRWVDFIAPVVGDLFGVTP